MAARTQKQLDNDARLRDAAKARRGESATVDYNAAPYTGQVIESDDAYAGIRGDMKPDAEFGQVDGDDGFMLNDHIKADLRQGYYDALMLDYPDGFNSHLTALVNGDASFHAYLSDLMASKDGETIRQAAADAKPMQEAGTALMGAIDDAFKKLGPDAVPYVGTGYTYHETEVADSTTCYEWVIPGSPLYYRAPASCTTVDDAREYVLTTNELDALTVQWINTTAPEQVRDRVSVTLTHAQALADNEKLSFEIAQYADVKTFCKSIGIAPTVEGVQAWKQAQDETTQAFRLTIKADLDSRAQRIMAAVATAKSALDALAEATGFAPKPEPPARKADWSHDAVISLRPGADPLIRQEAAGATFTDTLPGDVLSDAALRGKALQTRVNEDIMRMRTTRPLTPLEQGDLRAYMAAVSGIA